MFEELYSQTERRERSGCDGGQSRREFQQFAEKSRFQVQKLNDVGGATGLMSMLVAGESHMSCTSTTCSRRGNRATEDPRPGCGSSHAEPIDF